MSCSHPLLFLDLGVKENGKRNLRMIPQRVDYNIRSLKEKYGDKSILMIPCGKCEGCVKDYRRQWSIRCEAEARLYKDNCFITLTLENEFNTGKLDKRDFQLFMKALRSSGIKCRYFACGEYGSDEYTHRPHYHAILFGYIPDDLKYVGKSPKTRFPLFHSDKLSKIWKKGIVTVQWFDPHCASYVAGYVNKKIDNKEGFLLMSNRPGIGADYYRQHMNHLLENDNFVSKGGFAAKLPRYCEKIADQMFYDISDLKEERLKRAVVFNLGSCQEHGFNNLEQLLEYCGEIERRKKKYARNL